MLKTRRKIKCGYLIILLVIVFGATLVVINHLRSPFTKKGYSFVQTTVFSFLNHDDQQDILTRDYHQQYFEILFNKKYMIENSVKYREFMDHNPDADIGAVVYCVNNNIDYEYYLTINDNLYAKDPYYLKRNYQRYVEYASYSGSEDIRDVVASVNCGIDRKRYVDAIKTDTSYGKLMLVNRYHYLEDDYEPDNLVPIDRDYGIDLIDQEVYQQYVKMFNDMKDMGLNIYGNSPYRNYQLQNEVFEEQSDRYGLDYANNYVAKPGFSEHQTGLAIDFISKNNPDVGFVYTDEYQWLKNNAHKYGFIERYQEGYEKYTGFNPESWHYRYVGKEVAKYLYQHQITFDEYYEYFVLGE